MQNIAELTVEALAQHQNALNCSVKQALTKKTVLDSILSSQTYVFIRLGSKQIGSFVGPIFYLQLILQQQTVCNKEHLRIP